MRWAGIALATLLATTACSINPAWTIRQQGADTGALLLDGVPFHPQTEYQCGPAALATVLGASGVPASPEALAPQVYLPARRGSLQLELVAATRRAGRIPYLVDRRPEALLQELRAGRPVLVLQNLLVRTVPRWHYAVVVGADPARGRLILNSGTRRGLPMRASRFLRTWDWADRWGLVALRPGEMPVDADPVRYLAAVADFETVAGAPAATAAYEAAMRRWPDDARPRLALGNQAYARGDRHTAARHFREGARRAPDDPVLANNHASALIELGCRAEARDVLDRADRSVPAGSRWREALSRTRAELAASRAARDPGCAALR